MRLIADLHLHSKYSRATSPDLDLDELAKWAKIKGIGLLGTGDFTHPTWFAELKRKLESLNNGLYSYKGVMFVLSTEVSNVFESAGKGRKVHTCLCMPSLEEVAQFNDLISKRADLASDGRITLGISPAETLDLAATASPGSFAFAAHAWTPWFGVFGSKTGFDALEDCYGTATKRIGALETGLSSDPEMNWKVSRLDKYALVSNSDAHSGPKLGREANVLDLPEAEFTYDGIFNAIRTKDQKRFAYTVEFYPEEGKYHFDGHRNCSVSLSPEESKKLRNLCPVCRRKLTVGVLSRVEELADRKNSGMPPGAIPFIHQVPLVEIIAQCLGKTTASKPVWEEYFRLVKAVGSEFAVLSADSGLLSKHATAEIADAIVRAREGKIRVVPGYDGVFGVIDVTKKDGGATGMVGQGKKEGKDEKGSSEADDKKKGKQAKQTTLDGY